MVFGENYDVLFWKLCEAVSKLSGRITNSMEQCAFWEACQENPRILWNTKFRHHLRIAHHLFLPWARSIQSMLPSYTSNINFNIILPTTYKSSKWPSSLRFTHQNVIFVSPFSHT
jgi:hypothetical protein